MMLDVVFIIILVLIFWATFAIPVSAIMLASTVMQRRLIMILAGYRAIIRQDCVAVNAGRPSAIANMQAVHVPRAISQQVMCQWSLAQPARSAMRP